MRSLSLSRADAVATPRCAGEGAFAQVVLARHKMTRQFVALKVIFLRNPEADDEALAGMLACACCSTCQQTHLQLRVLLAVVSGSLPAVSSCRSWSSGRLCCES